MNKKDENHRNSSRVPRGLVILVVGSHRVKLLDGELLQKMLLVGNLLEVKLLEGKLEEGFICVEVVGG